jgi:parvulin-like peptidyl-prolyl isomerase
MSKKNADLKKEEEKHREEEEDLDEEEEGEGEDEEDEEDEDEEHEARPAAATPAPDARRAHGRARHDDHGHAEDEEEGEGEDPYWWTPHAVMSVLVLIGVLGFFGVFNKLLGGLAARGGASNDKTAAAETTAPAATPPPAQRDEFGAKHFLVQYKGAMRAPATITRTEEEAKARATEALKKAKSGTKFEDVVKEYSDEPGAAQRGGDLGKFKKGQMVPDFQAAVEKLKVGEISDLVKTPFGYHVILRTQ